MEISCCTYCGKLFHSFEGQRYCPRCISVLEERFKLVKEYIYEHPEATAPEVAKEFDISIRTIYRWVREERLAFSEKSGFGLPCQSCGETINMGRYCPKCKLKLRNNLSNAYKSKPVENKRTSADYPKMRFLQDEY